jgi:hypothetical protein
VSKLGTSRQNYFAQPSTTDIAPEGADTVWGRRVQERVAPFCS